MNSFLWEYYRMKCRIDTVKKKIYSEARNEKKIWGGKKILSCNETFEYITKLLSSDEPAMVGRLGNTELRAMTYFSESVNRGERNTEDVFDKISLYSGFFPKEESKIIKFSKLMCEDMKYCDLLGVWFMQMEDYMIKRYLHSGKLAYLKDLEPWYYPDNPWSQVLENKKVLFIHPFEKTILNQAKKWDGIYPSTKILPHFELLTLKAVQTLAGNPDPRFSDWFEALEWMKTEALKYDFDIAIIGCGAYGFPLAAELKKEGKKAVHLGGCTQLFWGIKGHRWDEIPEIDRYYNNSWIYPLKEDEISNMKDVENRCYW